MPIIRLYYPRSEIVASDQSIYLPTTPGQAMDGSIQFRATRLYDAEGAVRGVFLPHHLTNTLSVGSVSFSTTVVYTIHLQEGSLSGVFAYVDSPYILPTDTIRTTPVFRTGVFEDARRVEVTIRGGDPRSLAIRYCP